MSRHIRMPRHVVALTVAPFVLVVAACSSDGAAGPSGATHSVSFSVSTSGSAPAFAQGLSFASAPAAGGVVIASGKDTLKIDSVRMVLASVTLWQAADTACGGDGHEDEHDGDCAPLKAGPMLVSLPLDTGAKQVFAVPVPKGSYNGIALRVHRPVPNPSDSATTAFLKAHPDWSGVSVMLDGSFDGKPVHWQGDPVIPMHERFSPAVVVSDTSGLNFTLHVDVARWFRSRSGGVLDPNNLTSDQRAQVADNIRSSLHAFDDDHRKGEDDGEHDGGH